MSRKSIDNGFNYLEPKTIAFNNSYNSGYPNGYQLNDESELITYYDMPITLGEFKNNWINSSIIISKYSLRMFD